MTSWAVPGTWAGTPTAANFNTIRDNLKHLYETLDGFGYPYAPVDPRLLGTATSTYAHSFPNYMRCYGRGTIASMRAQVKGSAGDIAWGVYGTNTELDWPGVRKATSGQVACPAIGIADVALIASVAVDPGDWFGWAGTDIAATIAGPVGTGIVGIMTVNLIARDINEAIEDLPENADTNLLQPGFLIGPLFVGVP